MGSLSQTLRQITRLSCLCSSASGALPWLLPSSTMGCTDTDTLVDTIQASPASTNLPATDTLLPATLLPTTTPGYLDILPTPRLSDPLSRGASPSVTSCRSTESSRRSPPPPP